MKKKRKVGFKILIIGKLPPPYIGPSIATEIILNSRLSEVFELVHLDTSDHRNINTLGAIDFWNIYLAFKHWFIFTWKIIKVVPDLVYMPVSQTSIGYIRDSVFILISKFFRKKVVCHLRGGNFKNWFDSTSMIMKNYVKHVHSLIDGQIVLGENLRGLFKGILPESKIFVVPNGGNFEILDNRKKHKDKIKVLYLANFHRTKGVLDVLKSVSFVFKQNTNIEYIFVGSWRDQKTRIEFESFVSAHNDLPIIVKGPLFGKEKFELYASSDIFVYPTYYPPEGHPWVVVEAMAAGLPIISTDQGAITESVMDGVNGFIVEKKSPYQIANKIKYFLENPGLRERMSFASRQLYLKNFTEEKMVEKISHCFNRILNES